MDYLICLIFPIDNIWANILLLILLGYDEDQNELTIWAVKHLYKYNMTILTESKTPTMVGHTFILYATKKENNAAR